MAQQQIRTPSNIRVIGADSGRKPVVGQIEGGDRAVPTFGGMPFSPDHCYATTKAGNPCSVPNVKGEKWCFSHVKDNG